MFNDFQNDPLCVSCVGTFFNYFVINISYVSE